MDSITQAVLGAVVVDACLGKSIGKKAAWWGLALGTLPDLDVVVRPWMDEVSFVGWHRGWSHGILAIILGPILISALLRWCHGARISWRMAYLASVLAWLTHVLIDCLTVYGTGLWEPFSSNWVQWNLLFIIDPLYTLPLLVATVAALLFPWQKSWRPWCTYLGLILSTLYVAWSGLVKSQMNNRFEQHMQQAGIEAVAWQTTPTVANTFLWRCLVKEHRDGRIGYWIGYASLWDAHGSVSWRWVPAQSELVDAHKDQRSVAMVDWFSKGYWNARSGPKGTRISDLRFGELTMATTVVESVDHPWIFTWYLSPDGEALKRSGLDYPENFSLAAVWYRMWGQRFAWEQ